MLRTCPRSSWKYWSSAWIVSSILLASSFVQAQDASKEPAVTGQPTEQVTRSLRVKSPNVTVRANPSATQPEAKTGQARQWAFLDENGKLTSEPLPGVTIQTTIPIPPLPAPVSTRSSVDPNAILMDTSHIFAVSVAKKTPEGKLQIGCQHSSDTTCTAAHENESRPVDIPDTGESTGANAEDNQ